MTTQPISIETSPLGAILDRATQVMAADTEDAVAESVPVLEGLAKDFGVTVPLRPYKTGDINVRRWREGTAPLFADRVQPHFNARLRKISGREDVYERFMAEGLERQDFVQLVGAGLVGGDSASNLLYCVARAVKGKIGVSPAETLSPHPYMRAGMLVPRWTIYGLIAGVAYYFHGSIPSLLYAVIVTLVGAGIIDGERFLYRSDKAAHRRFIKETGEHSRRTEELSPMLNRIRQQKDLLDRAEADAKERPVSRDFPEGRILSLRRSNGAYVEIPQQASDLIDCVDPANCMVVELPDGTREIRIADRTLASHNQLALPGEKIVGATSLQYVQRNGEIMIGRGSITCPTEMDITGPNLDCFPPGVGTAKPSGLRQMAAAITEILDGQARVRIVMGDFY